MKAPNCDVLLAELRVVRAKLERAEDKQPQEDASGRKVYKRKTVDASGDGSAPKVRLLENDVICQVTDGHVFLNTRQVFQLFPAPRTFSAVDVMLKVGGFFVRLIHRYRVPIEFIHPRPPMCRPRERSCSKAEREHSSPPELSRYGIRFNNLSSTLTKTYQPI